MQTKQLSTSPGGAGTASDVITIRTPAGGPVPGIFREVRYLRLGIGTGVEEIVIDPSKCRLDASFLTYSYNALPSSAASLRASVTDNGAGLVISLDAPRRITQISVSSLLTVGGPYVLELYRMDGNVPAEEPSFTASPRPSVSAQGGFSSERKSGAARSSGGSGGGGGGGEVMALLAESGGPGPGGGPTIVAEAETFVIIIGADVAFNVNFTDQRFLMKIRGAGGAYANLAVSSLTELTVQSYPRSPRVGFAFPAPGAAADPTAANFFWRAPGEIGNGTPAANGNLDEGPTLGAELARAAARYVEALRDQSPDGAPPTLPAVLDIAMVVESDAPCRFDFDAVEVDFRLARASFPDGADKLVLRFPGDTAVARKIPLSLPAGVTVKSATLQMVESLRSDRAAGFGGAGASDFPATRKGVRIHREMQAAQPITPPKAASVTGLTIGLIALEAGTTARVELREDVDGAPSGRILGKGTIAPAAVGRAEWSLIRFDDVVIVPSSPHWVVMTCDAGSLTWLTTDAEDTVHLRRKSDNGDEWSTTSILRDLRALQGLLTVGGSGGNAPALGMTVGGAAFPAGTPAGDRTVFDLAATLNTYLGSAPSVSGVVDIPVKCNALGPGSITVYPPRIEFER